MQGQAYGQSCTGQSRRNSDWKAAAASKYSSCGQRAKRCRSPALEPVLEHCELAIHVAQTCNVTSLHQQQQHGCSSSSLSTKGKPLRILSRLRDSYVNLMNDVATGADLAGMSSSFYSAGFGGPSGAGDYANFVSSPNARSSVNNKEEPTKAAICKPT